LAPEVSLSDLPSTSTQPIESFRPRPVRMTSLRNLQQWRDYQQQLNARRLQLPTPYPGS